MLKRRRSVLAASLTAAVLLGTLLGCGSDDDHTVAAPAATRTATPPPTATPSPTTRPNENLFGSTQAGGGRLTIDPAPHVPIFLSSCVGGSGDTCDGGTAIYIGTEPGFEEAEGAEPELPLYPLIDGVSLTLEVTAIDANTTLQFDNVAITTAGQSIEIGTTPGIHQDLEWRLVVPPGGSASGHSVSVKLTTTASQYSGSIVYTLPLVPSAGSPN